jgi:hypothetical protein
VDDEVLNQEKLAEGFFFAISTNCWYSDLTACSQQVTTMMRGAWA